MDRAVGVFSPSAMQKRGIAKIGAYHLKCFQYDGAKFTTQRKPAPQNINPNDYQKQRDRLQLMREGIDIVDNFSPAKKINRTYAMMVAPQSYHATTGDTALDRDVEDYLNEGWFPHADVTGQFNFFQMCEFGVMGMNVGGDYGWAFIRPGADDGMSEDDIVDLPFCIQAVEPDRIGGIYQNVVSNNYVAGVVIGDDGIPSHYRVFQRSMVTSLYTNPRDIPAAQFVHLMDPTRHDMYRSVSKFDSSSADFRDIYELFQFIKGKAKLAASLTVFTNSNGATVGSGAMDAYSTNLTPGSQGALQQDILHNQINHLPQGAAIEFPESGSPGEQVQYAIKQLLKFCAWSFNLPYSYALDAAELGGVSSRLESEQARAEFQRGQRLIVPKANRMKDAALMDAIGKGIFPVTVGAKVFKGRWGFQPHPQPDIGKEATAATTLRQNGLLDPIEFSQNTLGIDPVEMARNMDRWVTIQKETVKASGNTRQEVFGNDPVVPGTQDKGDATSSPSSSSHSPKTLSNAQIKTLESRSEYVELWKAMKAANPTWDSMRAWAAVYRIMSEGEFEPARLPS
jgi:hypothetical protein